MRTGIGHVYGVVSGAIAAGDADLGPGGKHLGIDRGVLHQQALAAGGCVDNVVLRAALGRNNLYAGIAIQSELQVKVWKIVISDQHRHANVSVVIIFEQAYIVGPSTHGANSSSPNP